MFRLVALVVSMSVGVAVPVTAQDPGPVATFSTRVDTVRVDVLVSEGGNPVVGLQPTDFEVLDNGVQQRIDFFLHSELPLNVVLALDTSGSVTGERLNQLRAAGRAILNGLKTDDKLALVTFGSTITVRTALTTDTALVDATYSAMALGETDLGRALVILFSDGLDTASFLTPENVLNTARRTDAVVYAVSVGSAGRGAFLSDVTQLTGGRVLSLESTQDMDRAFLEILNEFRQRYLLSYSPRGVSSSGWHRLDVRVKNRKVEIKARPGYLVGS
jgi:Ca-activated chloride channel family protein